MGSILHLVPLAAATFAGLTIWSWVANSDPLSWTDRSHHRSFYPRNVLPEPNSFHGMSCTDVNSICKSISESADWPSYEHLCLQHMYRCDIQRFPHVNDSEQQPLQSYLDARGIDSVTDIGPGDIEGMSCASAEVVCDMLYAKSDCGEALVVACHTKLSSCTVPIPQCSDNCSSFAARRPALPPVQSATETSRFIASSDPPTYWPGVEVYPGDIKRMPCQQAQLACPFYQGWPHRKDLADACAWTMIRCASDDSSEILSRGGGDDFPDAGDDGDDGDSDDDDDDDDGDVIIYPDDDGNDFGGIDWDDVDDDDDDDDDEYDDGFGFGDDHASAVRRLSQFNSRIMPRESRTREKPFLRIFEEYPRAFNKYYCRVRDGPDFCGGESSGYLGMCDEACLNPNVIGKRNNNDQAFNLALAHCTAGFPPIALCDDDANREMCNTRFNVWRQACEKAMYYKLHSTNSSDMEQSPLPPSIKRRARKEPPFMKIFRRYPRWFNAHYCIIRDNQFCPNVPRQQYREFCSKTKKCFAWMKTSVPPGPKMESAVQTVYEDCKAGAPMFSNDTQFCGPNEPAGFCEIRFDIWRTVCSDVWGNMHDPTPTSYEPPSMPGSTCDGQSCPSSDDEPKYEPSSAPYCTSDGCCCSDDDDEPTCEPSSTSNSSSDDCCCSNGDDEPCCEPSSTCDTPPDDCSCSCDCGGPMCCSGHH